MRRLKLLKGMYFNGISAVINLPFITIRLFNYEYQTDTYEHLIDFAVSSELFPAGE